MLMIEVSNAELAALRDWLSRFQIERSHGVGVIYQTIANIVQRIDESNPSTDRELLAHMATDIYASLTPAACGETLRPSEAANRAIAILTAIDQYRANRSGK